MGSFNNEYAVSDALFFLNFADSNVFSARRVRVRVRVKTKLLVCTFTALLLTLPFVILIFVSLSDLRFCLDFL